MSMSTDGAAIKPVYFMAKDKETDTNLRINDFDKPFPITPTDGRKPCKTLIVTVPRTFFHAQINFVYVFFVDCFLFFKGQCNCSLTIFRS